MAKKVVGKIGLQLQAGKATPAPPVGPALGPYSLNIMAFCKEYNERTQSQAGMVIPVQITVYEDRTFTFVTKTPPASFLIKRALGVESGSAIPNRNKIGKLTQKQLREIAEVKMADLNANDVENAMQELGSQLQPAVAKETSKALAKARTRDSMSAFSKLTEVVDGRVRIASQALL